jgi:hypothetical protein
MPYAASVSEVVRRRSSAIGALPGLVSQTARGLYAGTSRGTYGASSLLAIDSL